MIDIQKSLESHLGAPKHDRIPSDRVQAIRDVNLYSFTMREGRRLSTSNGLHVLSQGACKDVEDRLLVDLVYLDQKGHLQGKMYQLSLTLGKKAEQSRHCRGRGS